jgi:hypothetical protein
MQEVTSDGRISSKGVMATVLMSMANRRVRLRSLVADVCMSIAGQPQGILEVYEEESLQSAGGSSVSGMADRDARDVRQWYSMKHEKFSYKRCGAVAYVCEHGRQKITDAGQCLWYSRENWSTTLFM